MGFSARKFHTDTEVIEIGEGLLTRTLPREKWTHEAHFAAVVYLLQKKPELDLERELPRIIASYNEAVGGQNTDTSGYHETLTQFYIRLIRSFTRKAGGSSLHEVCNSLTASPFGNREFPLRFYSRDLLFSVTARKGWVEPDLAAFHFEA